MGDCNMAHFCLKADGRPERPYTMSGSKESGISVHLGGWNIGIKVKFWHDEIANQDYVDIHLTDGGTTQTVLKMVDSFNESDIGNIKRSIYEREKNNG